MFAEFTVTLCKVEIVDSESDIILNLVPVIRDPQRGRVQNPSQGRVVQNPGLVNSDLKA